jgi:DNA-binding transcriptional MerR regulator
MSVESVAQESVGLTVAVVARRVGVAPATLRTWERRYGIYPTDRSTGGHRRYSITDVARLELMRRLVLSGMPAGQAAKMALQSEIGKLEDASFFDSNVLTKTVDSLLSNISVDSEFSHPGGGAVLAMQGSSAIARGLAKAAFSLDAPACTQLIQNSLHAKGVVWTWEKLLFPVLFAIGKKWESSGQGIEAEHILSECITGQLKQISDQLTAPINMRPVLLAAAVDELHTIPQYVVAAALAERKIGSRSLGARVPHDSLLNAIKRLAPAAVLIWAQIPVKTIPVEYEILINSRPAPLLLMVGPGWPENLPNGFTRAGDLNSTITAISNALGQ